VTRERRQSRTIAYYCVATHMGGAEQSTLDLITRIEAQTLGWYRPWVILPQDDGPLVDRLRDHDVPISVLPMPQGFFGMSRERPVRSLLMGALTWPAMRSYLAKLQLLVEREAPSLVHTTGIKCHALSVRLSKSVPVLWHLRDILSGGPARTILRRARSRSSVHVIANSYATALAFDTSNENPDVVYNGIDPERFVPGRGRMFRDALAVGPEVPILGIVGVLERGKGVSEFLDMAALLAEDGIDARYVVVGDQIYDTGRDAGFRAELEAQVEDLDLGGVVHFAGFQNDTVRVMQSLDLLVSASTKPESFGRVVVEAMACGVPVAASALGGVLEIIDDRVTGRLFPPGDASAMARAVRSLLTDDVLREACVINGRTRVEERFSSRNYVAGVVRTYDRILTGGM
jgi:glycosyltransferase involved in cell wall biosynthesis